MLKHREYESKRLRRRTLLAGAGSALLGAWAGRLGAAPETLAGEAAVPTDYRVERGRIKQSVYGWCFQPMPGEELIRACHRMGITSMDVGKEHYPLLAQLGMKVTMVGSHGFKRGPFNPANRDYCVEALRESIRLAAQWGCPKVITFTGMREKGVSDEAGARHCVECWQQVMADAEANNVTLCLEMLNSRDSSHPMKGHPGYFGDDVERCIDLIKRVDSPRLKLLFDVYHVQIMNGDVIRRIRQYKHYIGHYHVAGVPGRCEPDDNQEVNYPAVLAEILASGYEGYVSQEFIPTWPDKLAALRHAVRHCDI